MFLTTTYSSWQAACKCALYCCGVWSSDSFPKKITLLETCRHYSKQFHSNPPKLYKGRLGGDIIQIFKFSTFENTWRWPPWRKPSAFEISIAIFRFRIFGPFLAWEPGSYWNFLVLLTNLEVKTVIKHQFPVRQWEQQHQHVVVCVVIMIFHDKFKWLIEVSYAVLFGLL